MVNASIPSELGGDTERRDSLKLENAIASRFWGGFQIRIVLTYIVFAIAWIAAIALALNDAFPLWVGLVLNTFLASTFYMPMHEAVHKNIWGRQFCGRRFEDIIGMVCAIPLGFSFVSHHSSHMKHHAYTNDPNRDPDHFTDGPYSAMPAKWLSTVVVYALLPLITFVPPTRKLVHPRLQKSMSAGGDKQMGLCNCDFWLLCMERCSLHLCLGTVGLHCCCGMCRQGFRLFGCSLFLRGIHITRCITSFHVSRITTCQNCGERQRVILF